MNLLRTTRAWGDSHKKTRVAIYVTLCLVIGLFGPFVLRDDADASSDQQSGAGSGATQRAEERGPACRTAPRPANAAIVENECPNKPKKDPDSLRETKRQIKKSKWNAARKKASFFEKRHQEADAQDRTHVEAGERPLRGAGDRQGRHPGKAVQDMEEVAQCHHVH